MVLVAYLDSNHDIGRLLPWPARLAAACAEELLVLVPASEGKSSKVKSVRLRDSGDEPAPEGVDARIAAELAACVDGIFGADGWAPPAPATDGEPTGEDVPPENGVEASTAPDDTPQPQRVELRVLRAADPIQSVIAEVARVGARRLVAAQHRLEHEESDSSQRRSALLRNAPCEVVLVRPGNEEGEEAIDGGILVPSARGPHCAAAMRLALELDSAGYGPTTALYVEPDVGLDAEGVGRRVLDRIISKTGSADRVERRIVIDDQVTRGVVSTAEDLGSDVIVLGTSKVGALGRRMRSTVPKGVLRGAQRSTVVSVRAAIPLKNRAMHRLEAFLQQKVPQLGREQRIVLVERVQSNSQWDFDFVTLMSLATLIAAIGLVQSSAAVIIGAMLVAPLMTPLLGLGMALAQGNPQLARKTSISVGYGFAVAFALSVLVGVLVPRFVEATPEMLQRNWPDLLDLTVACIAGLAAAYASSRANLLDALPGVAIAAALVPPIATAGLATSLGDASLALGATLLFVTNMLAIVLAAAGALWAVGMRYQSGGSRWTRAQGTALVVGTGLLAIALGFLPVHYEPPDRVPRQLRTAIEETVGDDFVIERLRLATHLRPARLSVRVAGPQVPDSALVERLRDLMAEAVDGATEVHVEARWVATLR